MIIRVAAIDPAFVNFGIARLLLNTELLTLEVENLVVLKTENGVTKKNKVKKNADDLRRAMELHAGFHHHVKDCSLCFAEIPSGSQSAAASKSLGIALGVVASCPIPIIQVQPTDTKMAAVGTKTASKEEMIEWATRRYPAAPWKKRKLKGELVFTNDNEHIADACGVAHAGIKTAEFKRVLAEILAA
jgi:Holliday junction resolvasome RuvABC endonuclease subunit